MALKIPPPVLALLFGLAMWGISKTGFMSLFRSEFTAPLSLAILVPGFAIIISAVVSFRRASTTVNPMKPEAATQLISYGIYNLSRNPMYLGLSLILLSLVIWLGSALNVAVWFLFVWYITLFQIIPEEKALEEVFPETFSLYRSRVRRWI